MLRWFIEEIESISCWSSRLYVSAWQRRVRTQHKKCAIQTNRFRTKTILRIAQFVESLRCKTLRNNFAELPHFVQRVRKILIDGVSVRCCRDAVQDPEPIVPRRVCVTFPGIPAESERTMASIVTARFDQGNVTPLWKARSQISMRPVEYAGASAYSAYRTRHPRRLRIEPSASISKRTFDIVVAGAALLFFAPLLIAVAIAIKATSRGPVLFVQRRYGYRNRSFRDLQIPHDAN